MQHRFVRCLIAAAAALFACHVQAQVDSLSLNFGKIDYEYRNTRTGALPFALDIVVGNEGSVALRPNAAHDFSFKRGTFHTAEALPQAWLGFDFEHRGGRRVGLLDVGIDQSASGSSAGGGPHIKIFDGTTRSGASVHTGGVQMSLGDGSVHFIRDSVDVTLRGSPAQYFNRPGPGEPLEAYLPTPAEGETIELRLSVSDDRGARTLLPVRIARGD